MYQVGQKWLWTMSIASAHFILYGNKLGVLVYIITSIFVVVIIDVDAISVYYWEQTSSVCFPSQTR